MPNFFNILGGILAFIVCGVMTYMFWTPMWNFIGGMDSLQLQILLGVAWTAVCFIANLVLPILIMVADDYGN